LEFNMARFSLNPDVMQIDDGEATVTRRVRAQATDTSQITEQQMYEASRDAAIELGVDSVQLAYEAGMAGDTSKPMNKMTDEERKSFALGRSNRMTNERRFGTPDNPQPYEAPDGANWNLYGGKWSLYYKGYRIGDADGYSQSLIDEINRKSKRGDGVGVGNGLGVGDGNGDGLGGDNAVDTIVPPKPTDTGPTLASDVFKQTLAVFFGAAEMAKPWANELYKAVSKFYKQGATSEEAFNMALLESENNPLMTDFTKRFKGIFALQKMKQAGKAVTVPTIAEYFATETKMGDILKASNLGDLANEDFLGDVLSKGVSATEFGNRITAIFDRIDNAPSTIKKTISRFFPTLDRTQLAKALALGDKGAKQLEQEVAGYEVLSAAEFQGLGLSRELPSGIGVEQASDIAKGGGTYASTLGQFGQIAGARETEQKLAEISGMKSLGVSGLTKAVIGKSAAELKALEDLTRQEEARFSGKAGTIGSKTLASQSRANRII
jgi:hypothetical protein